MTTRFQKLLFISAIFFLIPTYLISKDLNSLTPSAKDTVYFELKTKMVENATVQKVKWKESTRYRIVIQLKNEYKKRFEDKTESSIGKRFAVTFNDHILSPILPMINSKIKSGKFTIEPFKNRSEAHSIMDQIINS